MTLKGKRLKNFKNHCFVAFFTKNCIPKTHPWIFHAVDRREEPRQKLIKRSTGKNKKLSTQTKNSISATFFYLWDASSSFFSPKAIGARTFFSWEETDKINRKNARFRKSLIPRQQYKSASFVDVLLRRTAYSTRAINTISDKGMICFENVLFNHLKQIRLLRKVLFDRFSLKNTSSVSNMKSFILFCAIIAMTTAVDYYPGSRQCRILFFPFWLNIARVRFFS